MGIGFFKYAIFPPSFLGFYDKMIKKAENWASNPKGMIGFQK
jgi:hypothetical protein